MTAPTVEERKRGDCLTAYLILVLILNPLVAVYYLISASTIARSFPLQARALPLLVLLSLANFAFALAIWNWRKWGLYSMVGTTALIFLFNVATEGIGDCGLRRRG